MTNEELKKWFIDKLESCYYVTHDDTPDSVYLYYDESIVRKIKMCKLNAIECKIDKLTGICLFEQDYKNNWLLCDYDNIWIFFEKNYRNNYADIQKFIMSILKEADKLNSSIPKTFGLSKWGVLKEQDKLHALIPYGVSQCILSPSILLQQDKIKIL